MNTTTQTHKTWARDRLVTVGSLLHADEIAAYRALYNRFLDGLRPSRRPMLSGSRPVAWLAALLLLVLASTLTGITPTSAATPANQSVSPPAVPTVIPVPQSMTLKGGHPFVLTKDTEIVVDGSGAATVGGYLANLLRPSTGYPLPVSDHGRGKQVIELRVAGVDLGVEGYQLEVNTDRVLLRASSAEGLSRGVQTLRQLLPAEVEAHRVQSGKWTVPAVHVRDKPRFAWRGSMIDPARNFLTVQEIKQHIDTLALYKINILHLHLTDDQGWRLAIKSWPRLTEVGGSTEWGPGPGGYYTQDEYRDIVAYAAERYITIVPEIDMPGHSTAAVRSYPELSCDGRAGELCPDKSVTDKFLDDVIREVAALTPGPYIHIGGDESDMSDETYVRFIQRAEHIVQKHGKRMVGWDEAATAGLSAHSVNQHWYYSDLAATAAQQGVPVVMSPASYAYFDMAYNKDTQGRAWAGRISVQRAYEWNPATLIKGVGESNVLGVEGPVWGFPEWGDVPSGAAFDTFKGLQFMAFPRTAALAEVGWSAQQDRSWADFRERLGRQGARLERLASNYYRAPDVPWPFGFNLDTTELHPGKSFTAVARMRNDYGFSTLTDARFQLDVPEQFVVRPLSNTKAESVAPGETFTARWEVTVPSGYDPSAPIEYAEVGATASYVHAGVRQSAQERERVSVVTPVQAPYLTADHDANAIFGQKDGHFSILAGGRDAWGPIDEYGTIYRDDILSNEGTVTVKVLSQENTGQWARAGIIVRNDLAKSGSTGLVSVFITPGNGCAMTWDSNGDGYNDRVAQVPGVKAPVYLRLKRSGTGYTGQCSANGTDWTTVAAVDVPGAAAVQDAGMYVSAAAREIGGLVQFTGFGVQSDLPSGPAAG
ncbi:family 20 glycosylhydrolase [Streptomyces sp. NPDC005151]